MTATDTLDAVNVAEYFLFKSNVEDTEVTNKKLQKLLYYSQAWNLAINNEKMFKDRIEAWVHGPAIREVYIKYKSFGSEPIKIDIDETTVKDISVERKKVLDEVWSVYGKFDGAYLERLSHSEGPWQEARRGLEAHEGSQNEITTDSMKNFYSELRSKNKSV